MVGEALARGSRITGAQRAELAAQLGRRYAAGESIRAIAEDAGRSFGFVHGLVKEAGVDLRGRGGATRGAGARGAAAPTTTKVPAVGPLDRSGPTVETATTPSQPGGGAEAPGQGGAGAKGAGSKSGSKDAQPKDAKPKDAKLKDAKPKDAKPEDAKAKGRDGKGKGGKGKDKKAGAKGGGKR